MLEIPTTDFDAGTVFWFTLDGGDFIPVPEPSSSMLGLLGAGLLLVRRKRA